VRGPGRRRPRCAGCTRTGSRHSCPAGSPSPPDHGPAPPNRTRTLTRTRRHRCRCRSTIPPARSAVRKFSRRMLPLLVFMLVVNQMDRTNVGFVQAHLKVDLGIGSAAFGLGGGACSSSATRCSRCPATCCWSGSAARVWLTRHHDHLGSGGGRDRVHHQRGVVLLHAVPARGWPRPASSRVSCTTSPPGCPTPTGAGPARSSWAARRRPTSSPGPISGRAAGAARRRWARRLEVDVPAGGARSPSRWASAPGFLLVSRVRDAKWLTDVEKDALSAAIAEDQLARRGRRQRAGVAGGGCSPTPRCCCCAGSSSPCR